MMESFRDEGKTPARDKIVAEKMTNGPKQQAKQTDRTDKLAAKPT